MSLFPQPATHSDAIVLFLRRLRMKLKIVWRKMCYYVRNDLNEIAFPSSLPDPPHIEKRTKLTWKEHYYVLKEASRLYTASWLQDIGPDLRPNDYNKYEDSGVKPQGETGANKTEEPYTLEDLAVAARGGMDTLRPVLQRVYMTRASSYRDALKSFIQGYQEGTQEVMEKKAESASDQIEDTPKKYNLNMKVSALSCWKACCNRGCQVRSFSATPSVQSVAEYAEHPVRVSVCHLQALLQKCATSLTVKKGLVLHSQIIQAGLQVDTLLSNILINMYSKCGLVDYARKVFDMMPERSVVSWNTMIGAYTQRGEKEQALNLFMQMQREQTSPSEFTLSSVLCACASKSAVCESKQLQALALKIAFDSNVYVGTALLDVYAKSEFINDARSIFDHMPERSAVTWSSMVSGYVQNNLYEESLMLYHRGQMVDVGRSKFTLSAILSACASLSALIEGNQVHSVLVRIGFHSDIFVSASLIDMYAKCGSIEDAYLVFSLVEERNIVLWNALMSGFSRHARSLEAMILFEKMQQSGTFPNEVTYVSVLSACSHMGLVEIGQRYFDLMTHDPKVYPNVQHFSCMVDLLGRAGKIDEAYTLIQSMPFDATAAMWGSLLSSCKIYKNLKLAEIAAKHLFHMEPENGGNHVLLSNIYAANKMWGEVARSRKHLHDSGVRKEIGKSWIEVKGKVHTFTVGEGNHLRITETYAKLENLVLETKKLKYKADTDYDLHDVEVDEKEQLLRHHSEKLALAFGLISLPSAAPIRIKKNLRICGDCHSFITVVSKITGRNIIVRDINRFHHFKEGSCSCGGFW